MAVFKFDHDQAAEMLRQNMAPKDVAAALGVGLTVIYGVRRGMEPEAQVEVPAWVPKEYVEDYQIIAEEDGEEAAAAYVRRKKRGNVEASGVPSVSAPNLLITRTAYNAAMAEFKPEHQSVLYYLRIVGAVTRMPIRRIASDERSYNLTRARHIAIYLASNAIKPRLSNRQIGRHFGNRDHTTLIHAKKRVAAVMDAHGIKWSDDAVELTQRLWDADWRARKAA